MKTTAEPFLIQNLEPVFHFCDAEAPASADEDDASATEDTDAASSDPEPDVAALMVSSAAISSTLSAYLMR